MINSMPWPIGTRMILLHEVPHPYDNQTYPSETVGVIRRHVETPEGINYALQMPDGAELLLPAESLRVLKTSKKETIRLTEEDAPPFDYTPFVIYRCVVGSKAYGLAHEHSDTDHRGIYLPPATRHWSFQGVPEQIEAIEPDDVCYWKFQKFLTLALKANPNILECLYTPLVEYATPLAEELLAMRSAFLSQLVYQTYNGYVMSQFRKIEQDLRNRNEIRWKHAMHLIRLLLAGITIVEHNTVPVDVGEHRTLLLNIRQGEMPWEDIVALRHQLNHRFEDAFRKTTLPERPDIRQANDLLIRARQTMVGL